MVRDRTDATVAVRRHRKDAARAVYPIELLSDVHWATPDATGGQDPPMLYASVSCQHAVHGTLHGCAPNGPCPHVVDVCVCVTDNTREVMAVLCSRAAGHRPAAADLSGHAAVVAWERASVAEVVPFGRHGAEQRPTDVS